MSVALGVLERRLDLENRNGRFSTASGFKKVEEVKEIKDMENHETRIALLEQNVVSLRQHLELMTLQISKLNDNIHTLKILIAVAVGLAAPEHVKGILGLLK